MYWDLLAPDDIFYSMSTLRCAHTEKCKRNPHRTLQRIYRLVDDDYDPDKSRVPGSIPVYRTSSSQIVYVQANTLLSCSVCYKFTFFRVGLCFKSRPRNSSNLAAKAPI